MRDSGVSLFSRDFAIVLLVLIALAFTGCVSVQKTGEGKTSPPPATTAVSFQSRPDSCEIYINGQFRGTTSVTLHLAAGTQAIEIRLDGYQTWSRELVVVAGDDTRVTATLRAE